MVIVIYERERVQGLARGAARPLIVNESFAQMRNEGDGFAEIDGSGRSCSGIRYLKCDVSRRSG